VPDTAMIRPKVWEASALLGAAAFFALAFLFAGVFDLSPIATSLIKGAGPFMLAIFASRHARSSEGWMLVIMMLFCTLGDGLIASQVAIATLMTGIAHIIGATLYLRHRQTRLSIGKRMAIYAIVPLTMSVAWFLPDGISTGDAIGTLVYALLVSLMVATAWSSKLAVTTVSIGVGLFLISDLMLFGIMGPLQGTDFVRGLIRALYMSGQILICIGITQHFSVKSRHR
jgi:uncharacterized membrane protein YhhN